jgi:hypothetical protein
MKARSLYGWAVAPVALWLTASTLLGLHLHNLDSESVIGPLNRVLISGQAWTLRLLPFVVIAGVLLGPILTIVVVVVGRRGTSMQSRRALLPWVFVTLVSWAGSLVTMLTMSSPGVFVLLAWSGLVSQALVVGIAFLAQSRLHRQGVSRIPPWVVLAGGGILQLTFVWPAFLVGGIPFLARLASEGKGPSNEGMHQTGRGVEDA